MKTPLIKYNWQADGLCKKELKFDQETKTFIPYTYDDFYPESGKSVTKEVKKLCNRCPIKNECLEHALYHEKFGYWGGKTEDQREMIRDQRGIICFAPQSNKQQQQVKGK